MSWQIAENNCFCPHEVMKKGALCMYAGVQRERWVFSVVYVCVISGYLPGCTDAQVLHMQGLFVRRAAAEEACCLFRSFAYRLICNIYNLYSCVGVLFGFPVSLY